MMIDIFSRLDRNRFAPEWCCLESGTADAATWLAELNQCNIPVTILADSKRPTSKIGRAWRLIIIGWRLWKYLRKIRPSILQTQLFADLYRPVGKLAGVPVVVGVEHNLDYDEPALLKIGKKLGRWSVDGIIAVSEAVKKDIIKRYRYSAKKVRVIYNGVDWDKFFSPIKFSAEDWPAGKIWRLGAAGRLVKQKGFDILIQALAQLPAEINWQCSIAGDGPQVDYLESLIIKLGLRDKVKLIGNQSDIVRFLSKLDLLVVSSRWEGLGLVVLEAGAAGIPVMASDVDGLQEIIDHKINGYLVSPESADALASGLTEIMSQISSAERLAWAANLQQKVKHDFSITATVDKYQDYYEQFS